MPASYPKPQQGICKPKMSQSVAWATGKVL